MCEPATIATVLAVASGGMQAYGQYQQGAAAKNYYDYSAKQAEMEGQIALQRGAKQSELIQDTAKVKGKQFKEDSAQFNAQQRAALSAAGVGGVTAEDVLGESFRKEKLDEAALRFNADSQSWEVTTDAMYKNYSAKNQAEQYRFAGRNAKSAAKRNMFSTLLGTAASTAGAFA